MNRADIAARYTKAGENGVMLEFATLCQEAKTKRDMVAVVETLDEEFHAGVISDGWVDWQEINRLIARRIASPDFDEEPAPNDQGKGAALAAPS